MKKHNIKLVRTTTVPISIKYFLIEQVNFLKNNGVDVYLASSKGEDISFIEEKTNTTVYIIPFLRQISFLNDLKTLWKTYLYLKKIKPDIVHSITPKAGLISMMAAYFARVPIRMHTYTGLIFPSKKGLFQKLLILMDKLLCVFATNIYPEGQGVKNDLIKYRITKKPLKVLANGNINGINTQYFSTSYFTEAERKELKSRLNISPDDFVFIFIGRLVGDKGINELVEAFKNLQKKQPNIKLLLVGNEEPELDPLKKETQKEIQKNKNIITTGWVEDVRPYFAIADALVFPSYREGFPNVVLQAGAMELPGIVTDINGCNEIITHQYNGLIIPPKDTIALQKAMEKILTDKGLYIQMKKNARPIIVDKYRQEMVWEALLEEYRRLLKEKGLK